ncbi:MAG: carboxypeptidase-like regulatory domain-containing protein [Myxococcota bacterium]
MRARRRRLDRRAYVWLVHDLGQSEALTDADGWFTLEAVPPGSWEVLAQKGSFQAAFDVDVEAGEVTELPSDTCLEQGEVEIAVVTGAWDTITVFLDRLGFAYDTVNGKRRTDLEAFLGDPPG